jgi:hypothetical protein
MAEADERRIVAEAAAVLPPRVHLEFEGRYAAMLSHEPKNYALLRYDGSLVLHGVAFRSSRAEPFGEAFLRKAIKYLLVGDISRRPRDVSGRFGSPSAARSAAGRYLVPSTAHKNTGRVFRGPGKPARATI